MTVSILSCVCGSTVIPQRFILCFMAFLGLAVAYCLRNSLHMAITKMVVERGGTIRREFIPELECHGTMSETLCNWTKEQKGIILGAFFPGYVLTHIPGGILSDKYGAKYVYAGGIAISSIFCLLTPVAVIYGGWWCLSIARFIMGLAQGPVFPCLSNLLAKWVPPRERGTWVCFVTTGAHLGTICGNLGSSFILHHSNWMMVFYFWGAISFIWCLFFTIFCYSEPAQHPFISTDEAMMLDEEIGVQQTFKIPWCKILTYGPIWALICAGIAHDLLYFFAIVQLPTYMADVLKVDIRKNGLMNSVPYVILAISSIINGVISDVLINTNRLSTITARKIFTTFGNLCPGICLVVMSYMGYSAAHVSIIFGLCMVGMGLFYAGMRTNALDVSKTFAGVVTAIVNAGGSIAFIPVSNLIALATPNSTLEEWRWVFWTLFAACTIITSGFVILGSSDRAPWDINQSEN